MARSGPRHLKAVPAPAEKPRRTYLVAVPDAARELQDRAHGADPFCTPDPMPGQLERHRPAGWAGEDYPDPPEAA